MNKKEILASLESLLVAVDKKLMEEVGGRHNPATVQASWREHYRDLDQGQIVVIYLSDSFSRLILNIPLQEVSLSPVSPDAAKKAWGKIKSKFEPRIRALLELLRKKA